MTPGLRKFAAVRCGIWRRIFSPRCRRLVAQGRRQSSQEGSTSLAVPTTDAPHVSLVAAAGDQIGQGLLRQARRMPIRQSLGPDEDRRQHRRGDEIAEAQGRREGLGDRPQVDNPSGTINACRGGIEAMSTRYSLS
jgi:hypothetical protein